MVSRIGGLCDLILSETSTHITSFQTLDCLSQMRTCLVVSHIPTHNHTCLLYPFILLSPKIYTFYALLNDTCRLWQVTSYTVKGNMYMSGNFGNCVSGAGMEMHKILKRHCVV